MCASMSGCLERTTEWPEPYRDDCDRDWLADNNTTGEECSRDPDPANNNTRQEEQDTNRSDSESR